MPFELKVTAENWGELVSSLPGGDDGNVFETMDFQALAAAFGKRAEAEGYDFELTKMGIKSVSQAEQRVQTARAKLRGDLEGSLKEAEEEPAAAPPPAEIEANEPAPKPAKKAKANGSAAKEETPDERKARCILIARDLYGHHKPAVMKILHEHGGGVKNFSQVAAENFIPIAAALEELKTSVGG